MELGDLVGQVAGFSALPPREKIRLFVWYLHTRSGREVVDYDAIRGCYTQIHLLPDKLSVYVPRMVGFGDLLKVKGGYKLEHAVRTALDAKYGVHQTVVQVSKLLTDLVGRVPDLAEREFLAEAIKCYRATAYRACIIMVWNLAYNHLLNWLLKDPARLATFRATIGKRNSKKAGMAIAKYDDFDDLKEREVIDICSSANLINSSVYKILVAKLDRRNIAAHPSNVVVVQHQADDAISDLVNNVVLALA